MAWPNPFRRHDENTRHCWGDLYTFQITPDHLTPEKSHPLKFSYDTLGEECLDILNGLTPSPQPASEGNMDATLIEVQESESSTNPKKASMFKAKRDLYLLLRGNLNRHQKLQQLWDEVSIVPEWVDWDQVRPFLQILSSAHKMPDCQRYADMFPLFIRGVHMMALKLHHC